MRIYEKKECLQSVNTLKSICRDLCLLPCSTGSELLLQCQELSITIGNRIEQREGLGFVTVGYLEEFCELLYQAYVCEDQNEYGQIIKKGEVLLKRIERSIKDDITNSPFEVLFMPYKASMWDSLDSVYRAAVADKTCHVVVMPVPYYNMNQREDQIEGHYEGGQFPADIPVTDFRTYSLEKMHPDVIFIHNPYDEYNCVTQLSKQYFSNNLIHYTDHLVYIPYFTTRGDSVKEQYCVMPAVQNAWRTFVQSEAVRKCYVKYGADPKRIVAMGSPKFDMVLKMQENPPELPKEWIPALERRRVFLLNTHLNPIINEAERVLNKLQQVFHLFEQRDDVALLWRPHPLSIETLKSMNATMLEQYLEIVEKFKTLKNGVYDDTPDVHRAIAVSDAYIGDWSSLVTMYGITGKPIYLFHTEGEDIVFADEEEKMFCFACGVFVEGILWVPSETSNALCKVNLMTGTVEYVASFDDAFIFGKELYHKIEFYDGKLFLIPWRAKKIVVYHIETGDIEYITQEPDAVYGVPKFSETIRYGQYLYLFPAHASAIVRLDLETQDVECYPECINDFKQFTKANYGFFWGGTNKKETAWIPSRRINCLLEYNMKSNSYIKHFIGERRTGFLDIESAGEQFYILTADNVILSWNNKNNDWKIIWQPYEDIETVLFLKMLYIKESLWLLPKCGEKIIKIKIRENYDVEELPLPSINKALDPGKNMIVDYIIQGNKIILCPANFNVVLTIDCETNEIKQIFIDGRDCYSELLKCYLQISENSNPNYLLNYGKCVSLEAFMNFSKSQKNLFMEERSTSFKRMQSNADGKCGQKIWQNVSREISFW